MKVNDIILYSFNTPPITETLCRIHSIDYITKETRHKVGGNFFRPIYEMRRTQVVDKVWLEKLGDSSGLIYSVNVPDWYDWDKMQAQASYLMNQVRLYTERIETTNEEIISAEEFLGSFGEEKYKLNHNLDRDGTGWPSTICEQAMKEFAIKHLAAQKKSILDVLDRRGKNNNIDRNIIINAYPKQRVK